MFAWHAAIRIVWHVVTDPLTMDEVRQRAAGRFVDYVLGPLAAVVALVTLVWMMVVGRFPCRRSRWGIVCLGFLVVDLFLQAAPALSYDCLRRLLDDVVLLPLVRPALLATTLMLYELALGARFVQWYLGLIVTLPILLPLLILLGLAELVFYSSTAVLLGSVWATVYFEVARAAWRRFMPCFRRTKHEDVLFGTSVEAHQTVVACHAQQAVLAPYLQLVPQAVPHARQLAELWVELLQSDESSLSLYAHHHRKVSTRTYQWGSVSSELLSVVSPSLNLVFDAELSKRPPSFAIHPRSFRHRTAELAGIVLWYLLPVSAFKRLHRPFRLRAFLPFLITYPVLDLFPFSYPTNYCRPLLTEPVEAFHFALYSFVEAAQAARPSLTKGELNSVLIGSLSAASAQYAALRAEEKAHEAILDGVLEWKARKEDLARISRRLKAE